MTLVEIALDDVGGALRAERAGAGRLELCASLGENGGTTPSIGFLEEVASSVAIPSMVLVRPRGGDFVYDADEVRVMERDIAAIRAIDARELGLVIGALTPSGGIDVDIVRRLLDAAAGAPVTFHRALDSARDLMGSAELLAELGVHRVLTSGGRRTAEEGAPVLRALVERLGGRLTVVVGGSVRAENAGRLLTLTGATEIHLRASGARPTAMTWSNPEQDYERLPTSATDGEVVRAVVDAVAGRAA